jgi:hypothetical protein
MPVVSDFTTVTENEFLFNGGTLTKTFGTGGRHNSDALLDVTALGGFRSDDTGMRIRVRINNSYNRTIMVNRWQTHSSIVQDRIAMKIPAGVLNSGNNTLRIEPLYEASSDYAFLGVVTCHFHQAA